MCSCALRLLGDGGGLRTNAGARPVFERPFRAQGLPARIRGDNGVPLLRITDANGYTSRNPRRV